MVGAWEPNRTVYPHDRSKARKLIALHVSNSHASGSFPAECGRLLQAALHMPTHRYKLMYMWASLAAGYIGSCDISDKTSLFHLLPLGEKFSAIVSTGPGWSHRSTIPLLRRAARLQGLQTYRNLLHHPTPLSHLSLPRLSSPGQTPNVTRNLHDHKYKGMSPSPFPTSQHSSFHLRPPCQNSNEFKLRQHQNQVL